jgi:hypothetical protein
MCSMSSVPCEPSALYIGVYVYVYVCVCVCVCVCVDVVCVY